MTHAVARGTLTFAFTDIVGSTQLWERAPEAAWRAIARHDLLLGDAVTRYGGSVFKNVGDACCSVFEEPAAAIRAAIAIQQDLAREPWPQEVGSLHVRVGIHTGDVLAEGGDYFGPTLNRVARLTSAAHGDEILVSAACAAIVESALPPDCALRDLGAHRLKDLAEPQHIFQLVAPGLACEFPPPVTLDAHPNNLPSQLADFVGRAGDLARLRDLLGANRLVTICGLGGVGKTRLALQVAADAIGYYPDGAWIVRLADVRDPALVGQAIASALHLPGVPAQAIEETLEQWLEARTLFLLLDNAEHLHDACARIVNRLIQRCPRLCVLVTSREPLHLSGERVLRIERLSAEDAAALFVNRANLAQDDGFVRDICEQLEGLPLAIELAAGRAATLGTQQLHARLKQMLPALVSKDRAGEERHHTLRATMEWSYRLLNPKEQRFFALLAVFEGGFTLEACEAVSWAGEEDDPAYELLDALVDKSFVAAERAGERVRYRLLELVRTFGLSRLRAAKEEELARDLHFRYFKGIADAWGAWPSEEEEHAYLDAIVPELPNLRSALQWGLDRSDPAEAFEMLMKVAQYWQQRCNLAEAREWLRRACAKAGDAHKALHARMLRRAATFATIADDYADARALTNQALEMFRELSDAAGTAESLHNLAVIEQRSGSEERAYRLYTEALELFEQTGHEVGTITALYNLAQTAKRRGDLETAQAYLERGVALCASPAHADRLATFWTLRGELAIQRGDFDSARSAFERSLEKKRTLRDPNGEMELLCNFAVLEIRRNHYAAAQQYARDALRLARELDVPSAIVACLELFAVVCLKKRQRRYAGQIAALARAMRERYGYVYGFMSELDADLAQIRSEPLDGGATREAIAHAVETLAGN